MKYITFTVPAYNSQAYLHTCIDSLLVIGDDCEIIIVNDGSKDDTLKIAQDYQKRYPTIINIIDKPNGGHGSGINAGLSQATGLYFKVVDSDDWLEEKALQKMIDTIKHHVIHHVNVDMYITNFTYAHQFESHVIRDYSRQFPHEKVFSWDEMKDMKYSMTLMMHAIIHRTEQLKASQVQLPHHTFYVDNIFVYDPLPYMNHLYYIPISLYQYYIGRADQSVTLRNISARYEQQIRVMKHLVEQYNYSQLMAYPKKLRHYMLHHLSAIMIITQMFTVSQDSQERRYHLKSFWQDLKKKDMRIYRYLRYQSYNVWVNFLPWKIKGYIMVKGYLYLKRKYKLG